MAAVPTRSLSSPGTAHYGFFLLDNFTMLSFSGVVEVLRLANRISEKPLYDWHILSINEKPISASNGLALHPTGSLHTLPPLNMLMVCGGINIHRVCTPEIIAVLQRLAKDKRIKIGGLCTGSFVLARAGLLNGYRCTIHWEHLAAMRELFPKLILSQELFEFDRDRMTSAGGTASIDMTLNIVAREHGSGLSNTIADMLVCDRIRSRHDRQRIPLRSRLGATQPRLLEAVALMEANIEEPISLNDIANYVSLSRRQLERLFQKYLQCVPTRYYLALRLERARQLLLQTNMSIVDIALASGFVSPPHFSKCYREYFSVPPRDERRRQHTLDTLESQISPHPIHS